MTGAEVLTILRETGRGEDHYETLGSGRLYAKRFPRIECADGFSLSVQAGWGLYSTPYEDAGPWTAVEVGYPSARPEPWDTEWVEFAEDPNNPEGTVYARVPLSMVECLIEKHGGAK